MIVVDTNIIAYLHLPGPRAVTAEALWRADPTWAAPLLWRSEFRNVLAGGLRAGKLRLHDANQVLRRAAAGLLGGEHVVADEAVMELVSRSRCPAYDCEFVALAEALGVPLVTDDKALLAAFPKHCRALNDYSGPPGRPDGGPNPARSGSV